MRKKWPEFENCLSTRGPHGARHVQPCQLVAMDEYKKHERSAACNGIDPLEICLAYAQDFLLYDQSGRRYAASSAAEYAKSPRAQRVNILERSYRRDAKLWLHETLADIVIDAAIYLQKTQGWKTVLYDGLRTMEGAFNLYNFATDSDLSSGLLALPGKSAHNKGLAVDSMMVDSSGCEVEMGGHFDNTDMSINMRFYTGNAISEQARGNRLIREAAFLRAAFANDLLIAPLRNEFWDDRLPEDRTDLWRVIDSVARVTAINFTRHNEDYKDCEKWNYDDFLAVWQQTFNGKEEKLLEIIGVSAPPQIEKFEFYHGNYHPIYDRDLRASGKNITD